MTPHLYSGSGPDGPKAFASLARLGIKTIISVDGARPNVEAAKKSGLRYVHIPISYDGVPRERALQLVRRQPAVMKRPDDFRAWLRVGETAALELESILRAAKNEMRIDIASAERAFQRTAATCSACHAKYRD